MTVLGLTPVTLAHRTRSRSAPVAREGALVAGDAAVLRCERLHRLPHAARQVPAALRPPQPRAALRRLRHDSEKSALSPALLLAVEQS